MILLTLHVLLPLLWAFTIISGRRVLNLWGFDSLWGSLTAGLGWLIPTFIFLYTGVTVKFLDNSAMRSLLTPYLHDTSLLSKLFFALAFVLALILCGGIWSQTLSLVPDSAVEASVHEAKSGGSLLLGTTSVTKPLTRRFFAGKHQFRFSADGYNVLEETITADRAGLNGTARRIVINLRSTADFVLRDFEVMSDGFHEPDNFLLPERFKHSPSQDVALSLASPSRTSLWLQGLYLNVNYVCPYKLSTFPLDGLGGGGPEPIRGYLELEPVVGRYKAVTQTKSQLGAGATPDTYNLRVLSPKGYFYRVSPEIEWVDMNNPQREGLFTLDQEIELEFPEIIEFTTFLKGAKKLRIVYDTSFSFIADWYLSGPNAPEYSALILPGGFELDLPKTADLPNVTIISQTEGGELFALLPEEKGYSRQLFLIDSKILLAHYKYKAGRPDFAEIIEDADRISVIEREFDALESRLKALNRKLVNEES